MTQAPPKSGDALPNQTLYVNGINEKIRKDELRKSLYALFSQFGPILEIVASKAFKMRGQAFIVFKDIASAAIALRQMNGFMFYDKPLKVQYAKSKSDVVAKADGTFVPRPRKEKKRKAEEQSKKAPATKRQEPLPATAVPSYPAAPPSYPGIVQPEPPNKILFVQNLPENATTESVAQYFAQFPGFKEVRLVPTKKGLAFVEFENEMQATIAMNGLNNLKVDETHAMNISYAKRG